MWVYRMGMERAKRMLLSGDTIDGRQAEQWGLGQAVPSPVVVRFRYFPKRIYKWPLSQNKKIE